MKNIVVGTPEDDELFAGLDFLGSENRVLGLAGNDELDSATGGFGGNTLSGGLGNDELFGVEQDQLFGDLGSDILTSDDQNASPNENFLSGGADNDMIFPGQGDIVSAGSGNDTIFAGKGSNLLRGGFGNDVFFLANAEAPDHPNTIDDFDPVEDTIQVALDGVASFRDLSFTPDGENVLIGLAGAPDPLAIVVNTTVENYIGGINIFVNNPGASNMGTSPTDTSVSTVAGLSFIGHEILDGNGLSLQFMDTTVGGLSGLTYDPFLNIFYGISDDRGSSSAPTSSVPRFYSLTLDLSDGALSDGDVVITDVTLLTDALGSLFQPSIIDAEGIAFSDSNSVFISSEGNSNDLIASEVFEFSLSGQQLQKLPVPDAFLPTADNSSGVRNNLGFESLTLTPDETILYTATENALFQDGDVATLDTGSPARILQYDLTTGLVVNQFTYVTDPISDAPIPADGFATNGLVELLALDNAGTLLALERSFAVGVGNNIRLYGISVVGLEDGGVIDLEDKTLLFDFEILEGQGIQIDNIEGLSMGPVLPSGNPSIVLVSDNNFNFDSQVTEFLAFEVELINNPPVFEAQSLTVPENSAVGTVVGPLSVTDPDDDPLTFSITGNADPDGDGNGAFGILGDQLVVTDGGDLDFESNPSLVIMVQASDGEFTDEAMITVNLTDVGEPTLEDFTLTGLEDEVIRLGAVNFTDMTRGNFQDVDGDSLAAVRIMTLPTSGLLTLVDEAVVEDQGIGVADLNNLEYTPATDENGTAVDMIKVKAIDSTGSESNAATITIDLSPVNDAPSFNLTQDGISAITGDTDVVLPGFATDISLGPADESTQTGTFTVATIRDPNGIVVGVPIDPETGDLTYSLVGNAAGTATLQVSLTDNGTTENGGVDTSEPANVSITATEAGSDPDLRGAFTRDTNDLITNGLTFNPVQDGVITVGSGATDQTEADFNNIVGLYEVVDESGGIDLNGDGAADPGLIPGLPDFDFSAYALAALTQDDAATPEIEGVRVDSSDILTGDSITTVDIQDPSGAIFLMGATFVAPFIIANGNEGGETVEDFINAENSEEDGIFNDAADSVDDPVTYFSYGAANPDGVAHLISWGSGIFGFEDLPGNLGVSDNDFNDAVFQFNFD